MVPVTGGDRNKFQNAEKHAQRNNSSSGSQKQAKNWDPSLGPPQYSAGLLNLLVGSDIAVYICVNIGIGGRGELIESNSSLRKYCDSGDQCVYLLSANMT